MNLLEKYLAKINAIKDEQYNLGPYETEKQADALILELLEEAGFGEIVAVSISLDRPDWDRELRELGG